MRISSNDIKVDVPVANPDQQVVLQKQVQEGTLQKFQREAQEQTQSMQEKRELSSEELQKLMEEIKRKFDTLNKYLRIDIDRDLDIPVAKIIERDTNRVIRQIPPDYLLELMKKIDQLLGILLQKEA